MALSTLTFHQPVRRTPPQTTSEFELRDQAIEHYAAGELDAAVHKTLLHLFGAAPTMEEIRRDGFRFVQGSSRVTMSIQGNEVTISVPLVRLPDGPTTTAALRYLLSRASGSGQLHQPRLRADDVRLEFREALERLHPVKLLEVLRGMPGAADSADDWMIAQFGAVALDREPAEALTAEEMARALEIWRAHWQEIEELLKEVQRKRSVWFLNEVTSHARGNLRYLLPLTGFLPGRLNESAALFNDSDADPTRREAALGKCIKEMRAIDEGMLRESLGHARYAISPMGEGTARVIVHYFGPGNYSETIKRLRASGKAMDAALALGSSFVSLLAHYAWPEDIATRVRAALDEASGRPFPEMAAILTRHARDLVDYVESAEEDEDEDGGDEGDAAEAEGEAQ
ncbi:MAG: hypothetical protein HOV80_24890 [Polyangiaceae bacterium]|nr:hypothetical protein [Polyangiaceae bacterium]